MGNMAEDHRVKVSIGERCIGRTQRWDSCKTSLERTRSTTAVRELVNSSRISRAVSKDLQVQVLGRDTRATVLGEDRQ